MKIWHLVLGVHISILSWTANAQTSCQAVLLPTPQSNQSTDPLLHVDLLQHRINEITNLSIKQIEDLNQETLYKNQDNNMASGLANRPLSITARQASKILSSMAFNPAIRGARSGDYAQPGIQIGYCFGRATHAHLALLKMGVDKRSIRKAWLVGSMKSGDVDWQFHVATIVRGENEKWYVLDSYFGTQAIELEAWYSKFKGMNAAGDLRMYVTDPQKFSISLGPYDRLQMGLTLPRDQDWYQGFFKDMLAWFRETDLEYMGLEPVNKLKKEKPSFWRSLFSDN